MSFNFVNIASIFTKVWGLHVACGLFFGELDVPQEEK